MTKTPSLSTWFAAGPIYNEIDLERLKGEMETNGWVVEDLRVNIVHMGTEMEDTLGEVAEVVNAIVDVPRSDPVKKPGWISFMGSFVLLCFFVATLFQKSVPKE